VFFKLRLKFWKERQLAMASARLSGEIDGLYYAARDLRDELEITTGDISALEVLGRNIDYGGEEDSALEHLRYREREIRQQINDVQSRIDRKQPELEAINHEREGRTPEYVKKGRKDHKRLEKVIKRGR